MDDLVIEETRDRNRWTWHSWKCPCGCTYISGPFAEASIRREASRIIRRHMARDEEIRNPSPEAIYLAELNARPGYTAWRNDDGSIQVQYSSRGLGKPEGASLFAWLLGLARMLRSGR